jgi:peroxiredoxin
VGIINGSPQEAKAWAKEYGAKFLILADPNMKIIRSYGAQHSPWALTVSKGKVSKVWNDGSATTLSALNKSAAKTAGAKLVAMTFDGAPSGGG